MNVKESIKELWKKGFFEDFKSVSQIDSKMLKDYGVTCSNTIMVLKTCKDFLRRDKKGWIQKTRHPAKFQKTSPKKIGFDMECFLDNSGLWHACKSSFNNQDYWDSCLHAFRHLETKIREKCNLPAEEHGVDLINKAFHPTQGILKIPACATRSEEEGFQLINRGVILFHRNAKGHREGTIGSQDAIKIIGYVDYLLNLLKTAQARN